MRKLYREPLLHFLALGFGLFLLFNIVSGAKGGADRRIVVNDGIVANIVRQHEGALKRPLMPNELQGLIDSYVREEILFREGVAMGLDRDDQVIRRRVQQKINTEQSAESVLAYFAGQPEVQSFLDVGERSRAVVIENPQRDDVGTRRHAGVGRVLRTDDAGDVGAVAVAVGRVAVVGPDEVVGKNDAIVDAVVVGVRPEEGMVEIDAGVDDDNGLARAVDGGKARIGAELIKPDQSGILL